MRSTGLIAFAATAIVAATPACADDQALVAAARREGEVVWYTTQIIPQLVTPVAAAFEKKYGVKVSYVRANASEVALRVVNEARAGKMNCDVFDGTTTVAALEHQNLVESWTPDSAKELPPMFVDKRGYWVATNLYIAVPAINTDLVPAAAAPKSWDDLLDPRWRGKMAISASNSPVGAPGLIALLLKTMGKERATDYLKKLAAQNVASIPVAARQVLDQVMAGEYAIGLHMQIHHVAASIAQGAPLRWLTSEPALVTLSTVSIAKGAPHPNAAKLLIEYLISREGQTIYRDADYVPAHPGVAVRDPKMVPKDENYRSVYVTPEEVDADLPQWNAMYKELLP